MIKRVLIVDDHEVVRLGVRALLAAKPNWEVCGEAADGEDAIQQVVRLVPDIVIVDLSLPLRNGFEVAQEIRRISPLTKIVFFSMHEVPATSRLLGANAFVSKASGMNVLMDALERVTESGASAST